MVVVVVVERGSMRVRVGEHNRLRKKDGIRFSDYEKGLKEVLWFVCC